MVRPRRVTRILEQLGRELGCLGPATLIQHRSRVEGEDVDSPQVLVVLEAMVERRGQNGDRRVKRVYLTPEAERVHRRIWRVAEATVDDALADLSARESAQLRDLLGRVKKSLIAVVDGGANGAAAHTRPAQRSAHRHNGSVA